MHGKRENRSRRLFRDAVVDSFEVSSASLRARARVHANFLLSRAELSCVRRWARGEGERGGREARAINRRHARVTTDRPEKSLPGSSTMRVIERRGLGAQRSAIEEPRGAGGYGHLAGSRRLHSRGLKGMHLVGSLDHRRCFSSVRALPFDRASLSLVGVGGGRAR